MAFTASDICKVRTTTPPLLTHKTYSLYSLPTSFQIMSVYKYSFPQRLLTPVPLDSFAIFLPPVGVFLERGCNADFVSIFLTLPVLTNSRLPCFVAVHQHSPRMYFPIPVSECLASDLTPDAFRPFWDTCMPVHYLLFPATL